MRRSRRRLIISAPVLLLVSIARAQQAGYVFSQGGTWLPGRPTSIVAVHQIGTAGYTVFLPHLSVAGAAAIVQVFGRSAGQRIGPALQFGYGVTALEYEVAIAGAAGASYRESWTLDGQPQPQLDLSSTVPDNAALFRNTIQFSAGGALPAAVYHLRVFVAEFLAAELSIQIIKL